ncbi:MAG: cation transporter [Pirellulales bacterium]|nr:cation transporter [Pirellulales bacterium]
MTPSAPSARSLYEQATRAAWVGLLANLGLGVVKLVGGLVGNSFALVSDAVNSLGDTFTSAVVLFALKVAQKPPDEEHPYGHTRAEAIAGTNVALLVIGSALAIGWEALQRIGSAEPAPQRWTLWIAGANAIIKEGLFQYKRRVAARTGSRAMIAHAWDHRADALCSLAVLIGLAAVRFGGEQFHWADSAAALVVVATVLISAGMVFRKSASELMDSQASSEFVEKVRSIAASIPGVTGVEKLWCRKSGLEYFVDIHIEVPPTMTVADGHEIGHDVKRQLQSQIPTLRDVLVHLEPCPKDHNCQQPSSSSGSN